MLVILVKRLFGLYSQQIYNIVVVDRFIPSAKIRSLAIGRYLQEDKFRISEHLMSILCLSDHHEFITEILSFNLNFYTVFFIVIVFCLPFD